MASLILRVFFYVSVGGLALLGGFLLSLMSINDLEQPSYVIALVEKIHRTIRLVIQTLDEPVSFFAYFVENFVMITIESIFSALLCVMIWYCIFRYIFGTFGFAKEPIARSPPSVKIRVVRFPASGAEATIEYVTTTTETVRVAPDFFPSHIPDLSKFWNHPPDMIYRRDWDVTQLKNTNFDGLYMTLYSFALEYLPENHHVPELFRDPVCRMFGDVFVAKLARGQCGHHGWALYEDVPLGFLNLDCVQRKFYK